MVFVIKGLVAVLLRSCLSTSSSFNFSPDDSADS